MVFDTQQFLVNVRNDILLIILVVNITAQNTLIKSIWYKSYNVRNYIENNS